MTMIKEESMSSERPGTPASGTERAYEPPAVTVIGTLEELTRGGGGNPGDGVFGSSFSVREGP
jgi:hypothetical protein